eukprot:759762-Rhodomonas_salina.1
MELEASQSEGTAERVQDLAGLDDGGRERQEREGAGTRGRLQPSGRNACKRSSSMCAPSWMDV